MTDRVDLEALDALAEAATEGPWFHHGASGGFVVARGDNPFHFDHGPVRVPIADTMYTRSGSTPKRKKQNIKDAALIVALRNAYPALSAEVRALRAALETIAAGREIRDPADACRSTIVVDVIDAAGIARAALKEPT